MPSNPIEPLLVSLLGIETMLEQLSREYADLYMHYDGQDFLEQSKLATDSLDNLVFAATHETASTLGFMRQNLCNLTKIITFRKTFNQFNDQDLALIIDKPTLSAIEKMQFRTKHEAILPKIAEIKSSWYQLFNQQSYAKIKSGLHI